MKLHRTNADVKFETKDYADGDLYNWQKTQSSEWEKYLSKDTMADSYMCGACEESDSHIPILENEFTLPFQCLWAFVFCSFYIEWNVPQTNLILFFFFRKWRRKEVFDIIIWKHCLLYYYIHNDFFNFLLVLHSTFGFLTVCTQVCYISFKSFIMRMKSAVYSRFARLR